MLKDKRMRVVKFVESDVDHQILFRERHILIHLTVHVQQEIKGWTAKERTSRVS
jgi:hypothetical protein